jgi:Putative Flp pilus-assembly TadE/G-like
MRNNGKLNSHRRSGERGQTIILVAVSLVSLLAMAALAIDVVTLYVARSEMQRAADAAALAGAKAFVDSGVTSLGPADPNLATVQGLAQTMATTIINSIVPQNRIQGTPPVLVGAPAFDFTRPGNPQVSVTLQRADLPTFFSRIWGRTLSTVSATAVAEAYNPANAPAGYPPIAPKCVKPLLVANQDPKAPGASPIVNPASGVPASTGVVGETALLRPCTGACPAVAGALQFRPAQVLPGTSNLCPSTCTPPATDYETSIECCDSANPPATQYECGPLVPNPPVNVDALLIDPPLSNGTNNGLQCLTNDPAADTIDPASLLELTAGSGPARITAASGPQNGNLVTTTRSIATFPIIENFSAAPLRVVGYLQVFVDPVTPAIPASTTVRILNVIGCGNSPGAGPPVLGGGYSSIPVRLIH